MQIFSLGGSKFSRRAHMQYCSLLKSGCVMPANLERPHH